MIRNCLVMFGFCVIVFFGFIFKLLVEICKEIKESERGWVVNGKYWFDFFVFEEVVFVYCDMEIEG